MSEEENSGAPSAYRADDLDDATSPASAAAPEDEEMRDILSCWAIRGAPASLDERVLASYRARFNVVPLWRRVLIGSISVPIPVAAAATLLLMLAGYFAFRNQSPVGLDGLRITRIDDPPRIVEVAVPQERTMTRTVYIDKRRVGKQSERHKPAGNDSARVVSVARTEEDKGAYLTRTDLSGFQPARDMSIRVIRRSDDNEK
jgi:hypothetical protein